jgi:DNA-binding beta-propeller fold protein YncE
VDVYVTEPGADIATATPVLTSVPFGAASDYLSVPAGDYQVRVTPAGTKIVVIDSGSLTLAAGQVRTAIAVDSPGGGAPFDLLVLADLN